MKRVSSISRLLSKNIQTTKPDPSTVTNTILTHLNSGQLTKAVSLLFSSPFPFPPFLYTRLFQFCASNLAIVEARKVESHLVTFSTITPVFLLNRAIETYGKCGHLEDARELFDEMPERDGGSWNAMITAYSRGRDAEKALLLFSDMNKSGVSANEITFASVLGSCAAVLDLFLARQVHGLVVKFGLCCNVILGSSLVDIYGKCEHMGDARRMFDEIPDPNAISWNVIVRRYLEYGDEKEAVVMFSEMIRAFVRPLNHTVSSALIACSSIFAIREGRQIHGMAFRVGYVEDEVVTTSLIDMYAKCGGLEYARRVFDQHSLKDVICWTKIVSAYAMCGEVVEARKIFNAMPERSVVSWNAMLSGYTRFSHWEEALNFVIWMRRVTKELDHVTLGLILNVCAGTCDLELGKQIHGFAYRHDICWNDFVGNALLDMYGKCRSKNSRAWFIEMGCSRDRVSWNALITSFARHRLSEEGLRMFTEMQWETIPSEFTFSTLLAACANIAAFEQGKQIHGYMLRNGYNFDVVVRGALVDMYSKCQCIEYGIKVFEENGSRDLILWNSMALGCAHNGRGEEVLELFGLMQDEGIKADNVTFQAVLLACIGEGFVDLGKQYFSSMSERYDVIPQWEHYECMIELFSRYGEMEELEEFIHKMPFEPTVPMLMRVFDACREYKYSKLGKWAAGRLNENDPLTPFQFDIWTEHSR